LSIRFYGKERWAGWQAEEVARPAINAFKILEIREILKIQ
jgi:hypothetical protein